MMDPERAGPLLATTAKLTVPEPVPEPVTPEMKLSGEDAVQAHVGELMVTVKDELLPAAVAESEFGESVAAQPLAWLTVKVLPATVSVPERATPELAI